ncbi:cell division protein FtsX [Ectothiorhodospiraceae bacterium 2226]|nr:cell division protein FtsX [Ectothiorhodospiraceae bacterium 2226]
MRRGRTTRLPIAGWAAHHGRAAVGTLGRLARAPLASLLTAAVVAIALALPAGLYLVTQNVQQLSGSWDSGAQISLFLRDEVDDAQGARFAEALRTRDGVARVEFLSRSGALAEFERLSGFADAVGTLDANPLPALVVVQPADAHGAPERASALAAQLQTLPEVDSAQLDLEWVQRLHLVMEIARRAVLVLGTLLGLAVLLVVGNTIRLAIENRREEIEITKLIGGTDVFIRRPFLYTGLWYGAAGGLLAWLALELALAALRGPVGQLAGLYQSAFTLSGLGLTQGLGLAAVGAGLGLLGSWLAVGRHLRAIEPD